MTYLSHVSLLDASIFTTIDEEKEDQKEIIQQFLKNVTYNWAKKNGKS